MTKRFFLALVLVGAIAASLSAQGIQRAISRISILNVANTLQLNGVLALSSTAPTVSSGFGTSPTIVNSNGVATFRVNVGTGGVATSGVVGLPTAVNGWNCVVIDISTNIVTRQTANNATTVTVTAASAWTAADILLFQCVGF